MRLLSPISVASSTIAAMTRDNLDAQSKAFTIVVGPVGDLGYITTGTADDVIINQAIQDVGAAGGGTAYLQPADYDITDTIVNDQEGVLVRGAVVGHFAKVTYLKASATFTNFATLAHINAGGFEDLYMDGDNTVTNGLVIGTASSTTKIKNPVVRNLRIEKFTGKGISGTGTPASGAWDDVVFLNVRIATCGVGVENHSTKTTFLGGTIGACTNGVTALISSAADFFGTVFTTNTRDFDVQTANSTGSYGFYSTYHESATNSILGRSVAPSGADTVGGFTFTGCHFLNQSQPTTGYALDFTSMGMTATLTNCSFYVTTDTSRTINVGTNTKLIVVGKGIGNTPLFTGTTSNVTYFGDNRLGIGKSVPDTPLHVYQDDSGVGANTGMTIEQDGTGDAILQFVLTGTRRWVMGVDNSDSDKFKISPTLDLNSAITLTMDTSGNLYLPASLAVGATSAAASAILDLSSTTKGALMPRMTSTQRDAISSPATGLIIYNTTANQLQYYNGTSWGAVAGSGSGEANTASNVGTAGVGVFKQKTGVDLEFKKINAGSNKVTITDDTGANELDIDVSPANFTGIPQSGVTDLTSDLALKAPLASPTFTGTVTSATIDIQGNSITGLQAVADDSQSGIKANFTAGEALVLGDACYMASTGKMMKADASAIATASAIAVATGTISADAVGAFVLYGIVRDDSAYSFTVGGLIYLSTTAGAITQTAPSGVDEVIQILGVALSADMWMLNPQLVQVEHV